MCAARRSHQPAAPPLTSRARELGCVFGLLTLVLLAAVSLPGCRSDGTKDVEAIRALVAREVEAINRKDLAALSQIWSRSADTLLFDVPLPGRFQGWERIAGVLKEFFDRLDEIHMTIDAVQVRADGQLAYVTYDWALSGKMGGDDVNDRGAATEVFHLSKDGWKLVHAHYSPTPPGLDGEPVPVAGASPGGKSVPAGAAKPAGKAD
jgi:ketosteroid isomerase-like protein